MTEVMQSIQSVCTMSGDIFATPAPELRKMIEGLPIRLYAPFKP